MLRGTEPARVEAWLEALDRSREIGRSTGVCSGFVVAIGDSSPLPVLDEAMIAGYRERFGSIDELHYRVFDQRLGEAGVHNELLGLTSPAEHLILSRPEVVAEPQAIWRLLAAFENPSVGVVEAKQLPLEHPKDYETVSGFTSWASSTFQMTPRALFESLGGFDSRTFSSAGYDVDYSWRLKEAGHTVVFQPSAVVFRDQPLDEKGRSVVTDEEAADAALAGLMLAHKWSRADVLSEEMSQFAHSSKEWECSAVTEFRRREDAGELPAQHDPANRVAHFEGRRHAKHRFKS